METKLSYVTIAVREPPAGKRDSWHVLLYDKKGDYYYAMGLDDLFRKYDDMFAKMRREFEQFKETVSAKSKEIEGDCGRFKETVSSQYNNLLDQVKSVSGKLIEMVEQEK